MAIDMDLLAWEPGEALRRIRRRLGMTQKQFAAHLTTVMGEKWSQDKVSEYETGVQSPTHREMRKWANRLGVPFRFIAEGIDPNRDKGLKRNRTKAIYNRPVPLAEVA